MIITLSNNNIAATINSYGAELSRLEKNNQNYIWTIDEAFWNKTSPILFPIVGRLKNDSYLIDGKIYKMPRHGFARNFDFEIEEQTESSVVFFLKDTSETLKLYPFQFELRLHYELIENSLNISYSVINRSNKLMPFSIGAHPAFAIKDCFSDYSLQFNATEKFVSYELENEHFNNVSRKINAKNGLIALDYMLFKNDALVFKELKSNKITLLKNNLPYLSVTFDDIPYLGIWTKPNAPFLCIEPWCGLADTSNHNGNIMEKEGIIKIQPHEIFYKTIQIEL